LVSGHSITIHVGNIDMARVFSFRVVVVAGVIETHVLHHLGERWPKLPSPLDAMRNSSVESSIMARYGIDAPVQVQPTMAVPSSPLLGERLRSPK
jgi:hypothetical protein